MAGTTDAQGRGVAALWCTIDRVDDGLEAGPALLARLTGPGLEFIDLMGCARRPAVAQGVTTIPLGSAPLFIRCPAGGAARLRIGDCTCRAAMNGAGGTRTSRPRSGHGIPGRSSQLIEPDAPALSAQAGEHLAAQRYAAAVELYERALALDAQRAPDWMNQGLALWYLQRHEQALACHDRALGSSRAMP